MRWILPGALVAAVVLAPAAFAQGVPKLNVLPSCRAGAEAYPSGGGEKACLENENQAHATLIKQWSEYSAGSRSRCVQMVKDISGTESYIELLSCLEMARDAERLPKGED